MEAYIRAGGFPEYYRCNYTNQSGFQYKGSVDYIFGSICLIFGIVCEKDLFIFPVYKFFLFITFFDMVNLVTSSILAGIFMIEGAVYCTHPHFIYIYGCFQVASWCGCCIGCFFLVLTRFMDAVSPRTHNRLFKGKRIYFILTFMLSYVVMVVFYGKPILFNSNLKAWIFDPLIFPNHSEEYFSAVITANNLLMVSLNCLLGAAFFFAFWFRMNSFYDFKLDKKQKQMMIQSCVLSIITFISALIYVYFQFNKVSMAVSLAGSFTWLISNTGGLFLYYVMNKTTQRRLFHLLKINKNSVETTSNATQPKSIVSKRSMVTK